MKTHEYQAREILKGYGIPFPPAQVAQTPEEAEAVARGLGGAVVVKAQALVGGRGKAGGVKRAATPAEARHAAAAILATPLKGRPVRKVLVAQVVPVVREYYLGAVLDRSVKAVTIMVSAMGGMDIEEVARTSPELDRPGVAGSSAGPRRLPDPRPGPRRRPRRRPSPRVPHRHPRALQGFLRAGLLAAGSQSARPHGGRRVHGARLQDGRRRQRPLPPAFAGRPPRSRSRDARRDRGAEGGRELYRTGGQCRLPGERGRSGHGDNGRYPAVRGRAGQLSRHRWRRPHRPGAGGAAHPSPRSLRAGGAGEHLRRDHPLRRGGSSSGRRHRRGRGEGSGGGPAGGDQRGRGAGDPGGHRRGAGRHHDRGGAEGRGAGRGGHPRGGRRLGRGRPGGRGADRHGADHRRREAGA